MRSETSQKLSPTVFSCLGQLYGATSRFLPSSYAWHLPCPVLYSRKADIANGNCSISGKRDSLPGNTVQRVRTHLGQIQGHHLDQSPRQGDECMRQAHPIIPTPAIAAQDIHASQFRLHIRELSAPHYFSAEKPPGSLQLDQRMLGWLEYVPVPAASMVRHRNVTSRPTLLHWHSLPTKHKQSSTTQNDTGPSNHDLLPDLKDI